LPQTVSVMRSVWTHRTLGLHVVGEEETTSSSTTKHKQRQSGPPGGKPMIEDVQSEIQCLLQMLWTEAGVKKITE